MVVRMALLVEISTDTKYATIEPLPQTNGNLPVSWGGLRKAAIVIGCSLWRGFLRLVASKLLL